MGVTTELERLRVLHQERVERLAARLRPRFEAGELRGWVDADFDSEHPHSPFDDLAEIARRSMARTFSEAYLVLACSPEEENAEGSVDLASAKWAAADCVAREILSIARSRRWYTPLPGEGPAVAARSYVAQRIEDHEQPRRHRRAA